jgi:Rrf2 family protein
LIFIKRDTDYAVKALLAIAAKAETRTSAAALSRDVRIPYAFLRRILQILSREGLVDSFPGKGGGFVLARSPEKINLGMLIRIFQGPISLGQCPFRKPVCFDAQTCPLRKKIKELQKKLVFDLESVTVDQMLGPEKKGHERIRRGVSGDDSRVRREKSPGGARQSRRQRISDPLDAQDRGIKKP